MTNHAPALAPDTLFDDPEREQRWRARFTAARVSLPDWARDEPEHTVYVSNVSGVWEIYAWDRRAGSHRQITDRPHGTSHATVSPDGKRIWWFNDTAGDEHGSWVSESFDDAGSRLEPAIAGTAPGYPAGLEIGDRVIAVGADTDDGTTVWLSRDGAPAEVVYRSEHNAGVAALSRDERLLAIAHSEHGDSRHLALRVLSTSDGAPAAEKWDGPGRGLDALSFSPVPGDARLLVAHERRGRDELLIWDVERDTETLIELDLPGDVTADWYPDGNALLIAHTFQARNTLHRFDIATGELSTLPIPAGTIGAANVRPDSTVEYSWSAAAHPPVVRELLADGTDRVLLEPAGPTAPSSVPVSDALVDGPGGPVHALVSRPAESPDGPLPTVFSVHGGPHAADEDRFSAYRAVWLDAGFAVVEVNYRGSTGYGSAWRDAIEGRPGLTELDDIAAVHDWAVESGLADPARCVIEGASWGGYLTLLALGTQPDRWVCAVAAVPVADYIAAYADEMEPLRDFDRALFGGSPEDLPDRYRECSPITYVDQVRAPVLIVAGENDPRCPIRQIDNYLGRLTKRGASHEVYRYDAGHGSLVVAETIKQTAMAVHFVLRHVNSDSDRVG
ncbi:MAG TPA: prolyl oligopeptidase family serine peptidase [Pseudonocardiaceae bacterium]|nr:prolyl oligopeptidase family serine peptidase [Pseudonocardiaceae bacterium]